MFYVINLKRRSDRKKNLDEKVKNLGIELNYIEAIDGTSKLPQNEIISSLNDYDNNPRISATILSHYNIWKKIAEGSDDYGVILEDDIFFNPDFKKHWTKIKQKISRFNKEETIIYIGMGDFLPIHTAPPSLTLLKAQEKSHILKNSTRYECFGTPDLNSAYIFDWHGAFSYILNKKTAIKLCQLAQINKITKGVDVWLKETNLPKLVSVPLLTYHGSFDSNIYDSDTWGVTMPTEEFELKRTDYKTRFLIPVLERCGVVAHLRNTIDVILEASKYPDQVEFSIVYSFENDEISEYIEKIRNIKPNNIYTTRINSDKLNINNIHTLYNNLQKDNKTTTFTAIWEDNKIISHEWDIKLFKHYEMYGSPTLACFQINSNTERNSDKLNNRISTSEIWNFRNPILTTKLLTTLDNVSNSPNIFEYLRYIVYLSKINIFVRDIKNLQIEATKGNEKQQDIIDNFYNNSTTKYFINTAMDTIKRSPEYRACGLWVPKPPLWGETTTIQESRIKVDNKTF